MLEIERSQITSEALVGILEEYASRGGFELEMSMEHRIQALQAKLEKGELKIIFDPKEETTNIVSASAWAASRSPGG